MQPPHAHSTEKVGRQNDDVALIFKEKKIKIPIFKGHLKRTHYSVITLKVTCAFLGGLLNNKKKQNETVQ